MKLCIAMMAAFMGTLAWANLPTINIENFSADYANPQGEGRADVFVYEDMDFGSHPDFLVYQQGGVFALESSLGEVALEGLPEAVMNWEQLSVERIDVSSSQNFFFFKSDALSYVDNEGKAGRVGGLELECKGRAKDLLESFLDLCFNHEMSFWLPSVSGASMNNISVSAKNNQLSFSLRNGARITGNGAIFFDQDRRTVRIRVDKAKIGFLNITGRFFSEVKEFENDYVRVNRPWIEISL